jgi:hypothetical protein
MTNNQKNGSGEIDRVRENTAQYVNEELDERAEDRVRGYAASSREEITARIKELEKEWSIERLIESEAPMMAITGLGLGAAVSRKFLALPAFVFGMVALHGVQGWYPMIPLFRRMGFRSRKEIDREKFAMKALRGDFRDVQSDDESERVEKAFAAVRS